MPTEIRVVQKEDGPSGWVYDVTVSEGKSSTVHAGSVRSTDYQSLTNGKVPPEVFVERSFQFLLEREPKESILSRFDITVIGRYFPEYEGEIRRRLQ